MVQAKVYFSNGSATLPSLRWHGIGPECPQAPAPTVSGLAEVRISLIPSEVLSNGGSFDMNVRHALPSAH